MRPRPRRAAAGALVIGLAMAGGVVAWDRADAADGGGPEQAGPAPIQGPAGSGPVDSGATTDEDTAAPTTEVERRDLITREETDGSLGYTDERAVASRRQGTLTWAVEEGSVVRPGAVLFRVDTEPVFYLSGGQPAWRALEDGVDDGWDVRQLEQNLVALGFDPDDEITVDTEFDNATEDAVERWQEKTHQAGATGRVELGTVVFLPGPSRRIAEVQATVGGGVGGGVLTTTATRREATFEVAARDAGIVEAGKRVEVELPDGTTVPGRVRLVGRVAQGGSDGAEGETDPTIEVSVKLEGAAVDAFDQAPVTIRIETEAERDALAVPVGALLATAGGGYALEVVKPTGHELVRVEVGAFADGYVQVTGEGIDEGTRVVQADL